jgi:hypothetical protein
MIRFFMVFNVESESERPVASPNISWKRVGPLVALGLDYLHQPLFSTNCPRR